MFLLIKIYELVFLISHLEAWTPGGGKGRLEHRKTASVRKTQEDGDANLEQRGSWEEATGGGAVGPAP